MDDDLHTNGTINSHSPGEPYASVFFPDSRNFVVEGGVFTSNVTNVTNNHHAYPASHDFRKIPMGEIDLQHEIRFDHDAGVVYLRRGQRCARKFYSAKIDGCKTSMTIAWYQGPDAEQAWRQDIAIHSRFRHPNFVQLYGVASTGSMHAAVFHDDLIPLEQFIGIYRNSPILSRYFRAYWWAEFNEVDRHLESMLNRTIDKNKRTLWIRGSNRRLCVDDTILNDDTGVFPSYSYLIEGSRWKPVREDIDIMSYNGPNHEAVVISSLALSHYHEFCDSDDFCASFCGHYSSHSHSFSISVHATATVGMVVKHHLSNCEVELPVNIAFLPLLDLGDISCGWSRGLSYGWCGPGEPEDVPSAIWHDKGLGGDLMPDSWRRYNLHQIFSAASIDRDVLFDHLEPWLGQANHIFSSLQIRSHHNQYVVINRVIFMCVFSPTTRSSFPSQGWLFVCPDDQLRSGPCSFRWPDCATYWSRDPFGAVRLSTEEAEEAGFPLIKLKIKVGGRAWNTIDYAALWRFHQAKGFVPNSQEIARHLGHPLYQLCDELAVEASFAHVTGEGIEEDQTDQHDTANTSAMGDEDEHEAVDSEHGDEDEKPGADILLPSPGFKFLFRLPTAILALMVLCCLSYTPY